MSLTRIINSVKSALLLRYNALWKTEVDGQSRLELYKIIKSEPAPELYTSLKYRERSMIAKIRSGTLPLNIETGRYRDIPVIDRICTNCENNNVETIEHFLYDCSRYHDIRILYQLPDITEINTWNDKVKIKTIQNFAKAAFLTRTI